MGKRYPISPGTRIGRSTGEIILEDLKVSSFHAQVEEDARGNLMLVDRGSSNGLLINGNKVLRIALLPSVNFIIGRTSFRVVQQVVPGVAKKTAAPKGWLETLTAQVPKIMAQNQPTPPDLMPFVDHVELEFIEGPRANQRVTLGYGPRKIGLEVLDIELLDPASPEVAFTLQPLHGEVFFQTDYPRTVLLNEDSRSTDKLKEGDMIRVGNTLIRVRIST